MPDIHRETHGSGWGCLQLLSALGVLLLSLATLIVLFPSTSVGVWAAVIAALVLAVIWWRASRAYHSRWGLLVVPILLVGVWILSEATGYLVHRPN